MFEHDFDHDKAAKLYRTLNTRVSGKPQKMTLERIRELIASDAYAVTFQTLGQYRTALLKAIDG